jgi:hypothetical protein
MTPGLAMAGLPCIPGEVDATVVQQQQQQQQQQSMWRGATHYMDGAHFDHGGPIGASIRQLPVLCVDRSPRLPEQYIPEFRAALQKIGRNW